MNIKQHITNTYNQGADLWRQGRLANLNSNDTKLLKQNRPHLFVEKPAMYAKVPDLTGKSVLALGCGSGEECEFLLSKNPKKIVGVDISEKLIQIAKENYPTVEFFVMDAENLKFKKKTFDFIYCSLMLDYFDSWTKVLSEIYRILKPNGTFLFSNLHPVKWSSQKINDEDGKAIGSSLGYEKDSKTCELKIYGDYHNTSLHQEKWLNSLDIYFYTKSVSTMFKELVDCGFSVVDIDEPKAIEETKKFDMDYWKVNQKIPNFIVFECKKI